MIAGDLVRVVAVNDATKQGIGLYLGRAHRNESQRSGPWHEAYLAFLWKGRVATFLPRYWKFEVMNDKR